MSIDVHVLAVYLFVPCLPCLFLTAALIWHRTVEGLRERTKHLNILFFSPITQWCSICDVLYWWKELNINYSVNIRSICLRILIDCSQLSKTYYNVLFGSSTRGRHARRIYRWHSENNIKCVVHDDLGWKNWTTHYILLRHWLYEWFSQFHSCGTYSILSRNPSVYPLISQHTSIYLFSFLLSAMPVHFFRVVLLWYNVIVQQDKTVKRKKVCEETVDTPAIYRQVWRRKRWLG